MKIGAKLICFYISEHYPVTRFGRSFQAEEIPLPVFYNRGEEPREGCFYIARTQDLPQISHVECLFVCTGNRPAHIGSSWKGEVLYVADRTLDIFVLFNFIITFFDRISRWDRTMQELLAKSAPVEEFVRASLPVFENCITITDYDLRILVTSEVKEEPAGRRHVVPDERFDRIPNKVIMTFVNTHRERVHIREPFLYKGQRENPEGENYCINLHLGDNYLGTCTLWSKLRPMRESDFLLFQQFAAYIQRVLCAQSRTSPTQIVTLKSIISDLLQCFPVSKGDLHWAMDLLQKNMEFQGVTLGCWHCIVILSANREKTLPESYLCTLLEDMLPHSTVVAYEEQMVCYCMIPDGENCEDTVCDILLPYLRDMNFRAGISAPFQDILKARDYYLQAHAILDTGYHLSREQHIYRFEDYIFPYMLWHCSGTFETELILSPGLEKLRTMSGGVDYLDTLRRYLDNECNASKTAQELYLHRSSLLPRLDKIKTLVNLDTPEERLYLRICLTLLDMMEKKK